MIAILCPTRGRPEQLKRMAESSCPANLYIGCVDPLKDLISPIAFDYKLLWTLPDNLPTAQKWNLLADEAMKDPENKLFMLGADDMIFETPGWDKALIDHYNSLENKIHVYALQDSRDIDGHPHIIVTREWIEFFGYFVIPIMTHWYVDTWAGEVAKANGVFTHLRGYRLLHDKPSDRGEPDETFSRIRSWGWKNRDDFVWEKCNHFLELDKERLRKWLHK